jgi:serine/threonine-protein kinase HipA
MKGTRTRASNTTPNGKRDDFTLEDLKQCAKTAGLKRGRPQTILTEVTETVSQWANFADEAGLPRKQTKAIQQAFRLTLPKA